MILCAAQLRAEAGSQKKNLYAHLRLIELAAAHKADLIVFPELSLTGYAPRQAQSLAYAPEDPRLAIFRQLSERHSLTLCVGLPTLADEGLHISMAIFPPAKRPLLYSKRMLHADELPYFIPGKNALTFPCKEAVIAPAICYESLQAEHSCEAAALHANVYLASVAKSAQGVDKAHPHYAAVAQKHHMTVIMSNCVGPCEDFEGAGHSAAWDAEGNLLAQMDSEREGIVLMDTKGKTARVVIG
jgi:predicted amidohydrolase